MTDAPEKPSDQRQRDLDAASRVIHECLISERMSVAILADAIAQARHDAMTDAADEILCQVQSMNVDIREAVKAGHLSAGHGERACRERISEELYRWVLRLRARAAEELPKVTKGTP